MVPPFWWWAIALVIIAALIIVHKTSHPIPQNTTYIGDVSFAEYAAFLNNYRGEVVSEDLISICDECIFQIDSTWVSADSCKNRPIRGINLMAAQEYCKWANTRLATKEEVRSLKYPVEFQFWITPEIKDSLNKSNSPRIHLVDKDGNFIDDKTVFSNKKSDTISFKISKNHD